MPDPRTPAPSIAEDDRPAWTAPRFPLDCGLVGALRAVPHRIEVTGHAPVWTVSAASVEDALSYANARFGDPHVIGSRVRRGLLGPRVAMRVTTDPDLVPLPPAAEDAGELVGESAVEPVSFLDHLLASEAALADADDSTDADGRAATAAAVDLLLARLDDDPVLDPPAVLVPTYRATPTGWPSPPPTRASARAVDDEDDVDGYVAPPVLPPAPAKGDDLLWDRGRLAQLGVSAEALEAMLTLPGSATMTWPERVRALVGQCRGASSDPLGGAAVVGYGPAGAAAVLSAVAAGVEAAGLRTEVGSRLLPVTGSRVVTLLERGLGSLECR